MITETTGARTWRDPRWRAGVLAWADDQLERLGLAPAGEPEQPHVQPWSTAFRLPLRDGGAVWLKSVGPGSAQEPALATALGGWAPDHVLVPLAAEPERRLLLLPDGGRTMREVGSREPADWAAMLVEHARLQVAVAPHAADLMRLGVPDHRPERLPGLAEELLTDDELQKLGTPDGLSEEDRDRVRADLGAYAEACRGLADGGVPASVQHDDLHDANVFVEGERHRFFDWGDASVGHPFLVLLVSLRFAARVLELPGGDPVLFGLRDAYLDQWLDFGTAAELRELSDLALRVAPLQRASSWRRILRGVHPEERTEWAEQVPGWTAQHLAPGTLRAGS
ncbi:aminoglycoside phosphotransferase family protein [Blastococcus sp. TF02-8]|uniref:phosphotransferase n=1 Tax=Blastococcus sp. TF02-8 TaxID=2250574 RepID=UPI000DEBC26C|nr:phosphotransferase [Blastococcus sp. TF02-8]RBY93397.1 aminoglycoside phosphotransferase family protein [Blastococcus sp. TF02-8]